MKKWIKYTIRFEWFMNKESIEILPKFTISHFDVCKMLVFELGWICFNATLIFKKKLSENL